MKIVFSLSLLLLFFSNNLCYTQELPGVWTLQDCIDYATKNNIQLSSLRLSTESSKQDLKQSKAAKLPNLTASSAQSLVNSNNTDPVVGGFQTQASFSSNYSLSSNITLYNGNYLNNDVKQKALYVQSAELSVAESSNSITLSITQAYYNILLTMENIAYLENVVKTSEEQERQGKLRYEAGNISRKDYLQFESQLSTDQYNLTTAHNNYRLNIFTLKQTLQLPSDYEMSIAQPVDSVLAGAATIRLNEAQHAAQEVRPEIKNKEIALQIAQVGLDKTKASRLPVVSMGGSLSSGYSDNQRPAYFRQLNSNFYQQAGLNISIPIFNRKVNQLNIARSKIQIDQAKLDLDNSKIVLNQAVEQAYLNLKNAQDSYITASALLNTSEETYKITTEQMDLGAINMIELLQQKNTYIQALQSYLQAKYTVALYNKVYTFYTTNEMK